MNTDQPTHSLWLHRYAVLVVLATLGLIAMGGLVTSHGAGMAVPDWPTSYGYNMFALPFRFWQGGIFYEHTHRLWASEVGLLMIVLNFWLFGKKSRPWVRGFGLLLLAAGIATGLRTSGWQAAVYYAIHGLVLFGASYVWPQCESSPRWLRRLGIIALVAVVVQGVLGGLRVVLFKDQIGVLHAALAQLFFVLLCIIALLTSRWWNGLPSKMAALASRPASDSQTLAYRNLGRWLLLTTCLIFLQLTIGATMRHQHAGLAIPDFPLAYGKLWPDTSAAAIAAYNAHRLEVTAAKDITAFQVWLQMAHRLTALLILAAVALCAWRARRSNAPQVVQKLALGWLGLVLVQAGLGAWTIWSNKAADVATLHVVTGALSLALGALLTIIAVRFPARAGSL